VIDACARRTFGFKGHKLNVDELCRRRSRRRLQPADRDPKRHRRTITYQRASFSCFRDNKILVYALFSTVSMLPSRCSVIRSHSLTNAPQISPQAAAGSRFKPLATNA